MKNQTTSAEEIRVILEQLIKKGANIQDLKNKVDGEIAKIETCVHCLQELLTSGLNDFQFSSADKTSEGVIHSLADASAGLQYDLEEAIEFFRSAFDKLQNHSRAHFQNELFCAFNKYSLSAIVTGL